MLIIGSSFLIGGSRLRHRGGVVDPPARVVLAETASLGFSAHSFLQQAVSPGDFGDLGAYWSGALFLNYNGFSSLKDRWDTNGIDRTGDYSGALIVTEIGDLQTGLADPASAQGVETLQYLFNYALTAQAKGCRLFGIYPPHSPEGLDLDADAMAKAQYWADWLRARPEITIPVHVIPVPVMVRAMIDRFAPSSIYADGLHLKTDVYGVPNQMNNAMGQMIRMFLTGTRPDNDPGWNQELRDLVEIAWGLVRDYACTGLGGTTVVAPYPVAADPLPDPVGRNLIPTDLMAAPWGAGGGATIRQDGLIAGQPAYLIEDAVPSYGSIVATGLGIAASGADRALALSVTLAKNPNRTSAFAMRATIGGLQGGMMVDPASGALTNTSYWPENVTARNVTDRGDHWLVQLRLTIPPGQTLTAIAIFPAHIGIPGGDAGAATGSHRIADFHVRDALV